MYEVVKIKHAAFEKGIKKKLLSSLDPQDMLMQKAIKAQLSKSLKNGVPIALYDAEQNRPYLEYPDGRRVYEIGE
ncbi:hypothetical protein FACS1894105_09000 [Clostridia bacterium]|nr:hypothetical protein FACS1894105_09000 [Clostridia bacterium]